MPLNYRQIQAQVQEFGREAPQRGQALRALREKAQALLNELDAETLTKRLDAALTADPRLRCARPAEEAPTARFPLPISPPKVYVLAADGSQINPDRHAPVLFYVINVGLVGIGFGLNEPPLEQVASRLYYGDQVLTRHGIFSEGRVALRRDLQERTLLAGAAAAARERLGGEIPLVTLTDGPLELWETRGDDQAAAQFDRALAEYLGELRRLRSIRAATGGYVDRPRADLVVRLLELTLLTDLSQVGRERPLFGVTDADLFRPVLGPGERSAVFALQSQSAARYADDLALHFFYLNVGREEHPALARVEVPAWVVHTPSLLDALHAVLVQQCAALGTSAYPYLLHRAHEAALVSRQEKERLMEMIMLELQRQGVSEVLAYSYKQRLKNLGRRNR